MVNSDGGKIMLTNKTIVPIFVFLALTLLTPFGCTSKEQEPEPVQEKYRKNLKIGLIGRQALISLKMYAATPSYGKHTVDIRNLQPNKKEISEAVRFVMSIDASNPRKDDLRIVLKDLGFNFDEINSDFTK